MNYTAKLYLKSDKSRHYLTKNNKSCWFFLKDYIIIADCCYLWLRCNTLSIHQYINTRSTHVQVITETLCSQCYSHYGLLLWHDAHCFHGFACLYNTHYLYSIRDILPSSSYHSAKHIQHIIYNSLAALKNVFFDVKKIP